MSINIEETAKDYSKYITVDVDEKLKPVNKLIENLHARLEEFQTMIYFAKEERVNAVDLLTLIVNSQEELNELFKRIDSVEALVEHVKSTLNVVEKDIEKAETEIGFSGDSRTAKVANIFTPLFKKSQEKNQIDNVKFFKTSDYFHPSEDNTS